MTEQGLLNGIQPSKTQGCSRVVEYLPRAHLSEWKDRLNRTETLELWSPEDQNLKTKCLLQNLQALAPLSKQWDELLQRFPKGSREQWSLLGPANSVNCSL